MTSIDEVLGVVVANREHSAEPEIEVVNHRMTVRRDAEYLLDLIKRTHPPKSPEMYDVNRPDGRFAYHHIIEYRLKGGE